MSVPKKVPNFFIVGAPKAGTTSLYAYLDQHPQIYMSPLKETHYFSREVRPENISEEWRPHVARNMREIEQYLRGDMREKRFGGLVTSWEDYLKLFRNVTDEIAIGEASPHYLWSETAPGAIAARFPHARIIVNLRNPVDRAYSDYLHMVTDGAIRRSFREQIVANMNCTDRQIGTVWPFLEYGHYYEQLQRYLNEFPRSQIHISFYDDLERAPAQLLADLFAFLGVDPDFAADISQRHNTPRIPKFAGAVYFLRKWRVWPYLRNLAPASLRPTLRSLMLRSRASLAMRPADRAFLTEYYREEIGKLAILLDRDLSSWL